MKLAKYPWINRTSISLLSAFLLFVALYNFIGTSSSATDENVFESPVSRFYLVKDITVSDSIPKGRSFESTGSLHKGVFILKINNQSLKDSGDIYNALSNKDAKNQIKILTYDSKTGVKKTVFTKPEYITDESVDFLHSAVVVVQVIKNGASDKAGLLVGDIIIEINGKPFKDIYDADNILRNSPINSAINYGIQRADQHLILKVIPVKFGIPFINVIQLLISLVFLIFGLFLSLHRPQIKASVILGLAHIVTFALLSLEYSRFLTLNETFGVLRIFIMIFAANLVYALFMHSSFLFPLEVREIIKKKWIVITIYSFVIFESLLRIVNIYSYKSLNINQYINILNIALVIFFIIIRIIYNKGYSLEYKKINRSVGLSLLITFLAISIINQLLTSFPSLLMDGNYFIWIRLLILVIPISFFFTISKYKLLDTNIRIKKNIQYVFASLITQVSTLAILLILLIWISQLNISFPNLTISGTNIEVLNTALSPESQQWYQKIFLIIITILFSIIGWKARIRILRFLDKKFHRVRFDYRKATSELAEILSKYLTIRELTTTIVREIADLAMLKKSGLIVFRNEETIAAHDYYGVSSSELYDLLSSSGITLVQSIKSFKEPFRVEYLPEPHKEILRAFGFVQVLPIYSKNKLLGAALIGEKKAESSLNRADIEFLNTFSGQLAVAIDNSFMYEECTLQERIMHELEIARRIQLASLPDSIPNIEGLDISGTSIPAYEVGGDFYDFLESDNGDFMMIIGDVSGKGTSAALYMSKIQGVIRTLHEFGLSPRQLLIRSNNILAKYIEKGYFISATIINFETSKHKAQFARAGHLPVYSYSNKNSELKRIISKGMVLGLTRDKLFERNLEEEELNYESGDILVFVTDGITESKNSMMVEFGEDRLIETIKANAKHTAEEIRNQIMKNSREFASNEPQFDDMTVVVIKIP